MNSIEDRLRDAYRGAAESVDPDTIRQLHERSATISPLATRPDSRLHRRLMIPLAAASAVALIAVVTAVIIPAALDRSLPSPGGRLPGWPVRRAARLRQPGEPDRPPPRRRPCGREDPGPAAGNDLHRSDIRRRPDLRGRAGPGGHLPELAVQVPARQRGASDRADCAARHQASRREGSAQQGQHDAGPRHRAVRPGPPGASCRAGGGESGVEPGQAVATSRSGRPQLALADGRREPARLYRQEQPGEGSGVRTAYECSARMGGPAQPGGGGGGPIWCSRRHPHGCHHAGRLHGLFLYQSRRVRACQPLAVAGGQPLDRAQPGRRPICGSPRRPGRRPVGHPRAHRGQAIARTGTVARAVARAVAVRVASSDASPTWPADPLGIAVPPAHPLRIAVPPARPLRIAVPPARSVTVAYPSPHPDADPVAVTVPVPGNAPAPADHSQLRVAAIPERSGLGSAGHARLLLVASAGPRHLDISGCRGPAVRVQV